MTGSGRGDHEGFGSLTAGYGSRRDPARSGREIGPAFAFGLSMGKASKALYDSLLRGG